MSTLDLLEHLKSLCTAPGLSAYETPVRDLIAATWSPWTDELSGDRLGSLWATRFGVGDEPRPRVMLAAHMDEIGLMVSNVHQGFLRVTKIGGVDVRVLPGTLVNVHPTYGTARPPEPLAGVVASKPPHLQARDERHSIPPLDELLIDVGLPPDEVADKVGVGDLVTFAQPPTVLGDDLLMAKSLDNRASVAAVSVCLNELQGRAHRWNVTAVATTQEEVTLGGAFTSAFGLRPDIAIAIDVTWARQPGLSSWETFALGEGPTVMWGPNLHPKLHAALMDFAKQREIPVHNELTPRHAGTDAYAIQVSREGIPTAGIGLPLKYMHTPVEVVSLKDISRAGRLMAEFIMSLDDEFVAKLVLE